MTEEEAIEADEMEQQLLACGDLPHNFRSLRDKNFLPVLEAIQRIRNVGDESTAERETEAYLVTAFHKAATKVTQHRTVKAVASLFAAAASTIVMTPLYQTPHKSAWFYVAGTVVAGIFACCARQLQIKEYLSVRQIRTEDGYYPHPRAWGDKMVYHRAQKEIDRLIDKGNLLKEIHGTRANKGGILQP